VTDEAPPPDWGFLALLRRLERRGGDRPRIGRNLNLADEIVAIGQDPSLAFAETDLTAYKPGRRARVRSNVLGYFGPQGALPLIQTEEVKRWVDRGDDAYVAFVDIFGTRFQQLFFRAWSDTRAITQADRPDDDRFLAHVLALLGRGTPSLNNRQIIPDPALAALSPLMVHRVKSPTRLRQMLMADLHLDVAVEEHRLSWLPIEVDNHNSLGMRGALGRDLYLGARVPSVNDRVRLHVAARTLAEYRLYLPGQPRHARLAALVRSMIGLTAEVEVQLTLPADQMPKARLGSSVELGWIASLAPRGGTGKMTGANFMLPAA
jgi:type VI secretion system protein ImpH